MMNNPDLEPFFAEVRSLMELVSVSDMEGALALTSTLIRDYPERPEPYYFLGLISFFTRDNGRAVEMIEKAHEMAPHVRDYADALANIYARMGKHAEGLYYAKLVTALEPHEHFASLLPQQIGNYFDSLAQATPSYHFTTAMKYFNLHAIDKCANQCEMELRINAEHHGAHDLLGQCYLLLNEPTRARRAFQSAIHFAPQQAAYHLHMGAALALLGLSDQAMASFDTALQYTDDERAMRNEILAALPQGQASSSAYRAAMMQSIGDLGADVFKLDIEHTASADGKIRIGYLGSWLDSATDLPFFAPILGNHNRNRFEVHIFYNSVNNSPGIRHMQSLVDGWHDVHDVDDDTLNTMISGNAIDILVDLDGAAARRRANLLASSPAPVVMGWPGPRMLDGLPGVTPLHALAPEGAPVVTREPPPLGDEASPLPASECGFVTFGALCDPAALSAQSVKTIAKILHTTPDAKLLMAWRGPIAADTAMFIADMFGDYGVGGKVAFHRHTGDTQRSTLGEDYFSEIDIFLDTFPVGAPDLVSEALWMGVPTICLGPDTSNASAGAADVLRQAGKSEWIAATPDAYAEAAKVLAGDIAALAATRATLREDVKNTALFMPKVAVAEYERLLTQIMEAQGA